MEDDVGRRQQGRKLVSAGDRFAVTPRGLAQMVDVLRHDGRDRRAQLGEEPAGGLDGLAADLDDGRAVEQAGLGVGAQLPELRAHDGHE